MINFKKIKLIRYSPSLLGQSLIRVYQLTLSPDHGLFKARYPHGFCRYYPSCSQYAYEALGRHGLVKGTALSLWRIMRCNPWAQPSIDLVP